MLFDIFAALIITFFAAVGMADISEWLLKNPLKKKIKHRVFIVAKLNSVKEEEIEPALRSILAETNGMHRSIFLDCENSSESSVAIAKKLEKRFDCSVFYSEDEVLRMFLNGLHTE